MDLNTLLKKRLHSIHLKAYNTGLSKSSKDDTSCVISLGIVEHSWSLSFWTMALLMYNWPGKSAVTGIKFVLRYSWITG